MAALAALALAFAAPLFAAEAPIVGFDAFPLPKGESFFSADGYHMAALSSTETEDLWTVDGLVRARGPLGSLPEGGVLSADGEVLLHAVTAPGGVRAAINGTPYGETYTEIAKLAVSARGRNGAYAAETPKGWIVVSAQGRGPAFPAPPERLEVTETSTVYVVDWEKRKWLYRDHRPVRALPYDSVSLSPDLSRAAGVLKTAYGTTVELDGRKLGPYASVSAPVFSPNGRHWAFQVFNGRSGRDSVVADGKPSVARRCACSLVVDDSGRVFQDELIIPIPKGDVHVFYLNGKELFRGGRPPHVATSPDGTRYVYPMMTGFGGSIGMNGALLRKHAPIPLPPWGPLAFDGPEEFHYWAVIGSRLHLICATVDGSDVMRTRCAERGAKGGWPVVP
jgi:hypothetical protein